MIMKDTEGKPIQEGDKKSESHLAPVAQPERNLVPYDPLPVSYTHLTLPTSDLV